MLIKVSELQVGDHIRVGRKEIYEVDQPLQENRIRAQELDWPATKRSYKNNYKWFNGDQYVEKVTVYA